MFGLFGMIKEGMIEITDECVRASHLVTYACRAPGFFGKRSPLLVLGGLQMLTTLS